MLAVKMKPSAGTSHSLSNQLPTFLGGAHSCTKQSSPQQHPTPTSPSVLSIPLFSFGIWSSRLVSGLHDAPNPPIRWGSPGEVCARSASCICDGYAVRTLRPHHQYACRKDLHPRAKAGAFLCWLSSFNSWNTFYLIRGRC